MDQSAIQRPRRILWLNVLTVLSAAILISAEVFGAAFAGSWAIASLFALGSLGARILDGLFVLCGIVVMVQLVLAPRRAVQRRVTRSPLRVLHGRSQLLRLVKTKRVAPPA